MGQERRARKGRLFSCLKYLGLLFFLLILLNLEWSTVAQHLSNIRPDYFIAAVLLNFLFFQCKSVRWLLILNSRNFNIPAIKAIKYYQAGSFFSFLTPGKVGDFIKAYYLKTYHEVRIAEGTSTVVADRLFDLITIAVSALTAVAFVYSPPEMRKAAFIFAALVMGIGALLYFKGPVSLTANILSRLPIVGKQITSKRHVAKEFYESLTRVDKPILYCGAFLFSLLAYLILFSGCYALAVSIGIQLSFMEVTYTILMANIASLLPISISGVGTRDLVVVALFGAYGISTEAAFLFSTMYLVVNIMAGNCLGLLFWLQMRSPESSKEIQAARVEAQGAT